VAAPHDVPAWTFLSAVMLASAIFALIWLR
jgi:hypothetical protein